MTDTEDEMPETEARKAAKHFAAMAEEAAKDLAQIDLVDAEKLRHSNAEELSKMAEQLGATIQPQVMLIDRIQCLIDFLIEDPAERVRFETFFELRMSRRIKQTWAEARAAIEQMESLQRQALLTQGLPGGASPADIKSLFGG